MKRVTFAVLLQLCLFTFSLANSLGEARVAIDTTDLSQSTTKSDILSATITPGPQELPPVTAKDESHKIGFPDAKEIGKKFCLLYHMAHSQGYGPNKIKAYIEEKFPKKWHNHLIGKLIFRGLLALIETAAQLCGVKEIEANKYLKRATRLETKYNLTFTQD